MLITKAEDRATGGPVAAAEALAEVFRRLDRQARREARTLPSGDERHAAETGFWTTMDFLRASERELSGPELTQARLAVREVLNPWLLRSRFWNRSATKPHGYAGDFRMLEWMYDLEHDPCTDATQPALVNVLDGLYATVHSVQAVWHRRRWFAQLLTDQAARRDEGPCRVLDVACGGSRYVRDVLRTFRPRPLQVTFFDQDAAALTFVADRTVAGADHELICAPVRRLADFVPDDAQFDLVISTGLFDYLPNADAAALLSHMVARTAPGGVTAVCNFAPEDASKVVKDWVSDWRLIYRTADQLRDLFGDPDRVRIDRSPDGGLVYAGIGCAHVEI